MLIQGTPAMEPHSSRSRVSPVAEKRGRALFQPVVGLYLSGRALPCSIKCEPALSHEASGASNC